MQQAKLKYHYWIVYCSLDEWYNLSNRINTRDVNGIILGKVLKSSCTLLGITEQVYGDAPNESTNPLTHKLDFDIILPNGHIPKQTELVKLDLTPDTYITLKDYTEGKSIAFTLKNNMVDKVFTVNLNSLKIIPNGFETIPSGDQTNELLILCGKDRSYDMESLSFIWVRKNEWLNNEIVFVPRTRNGASISYLKLFKCLYKVVNS